MKKHKLVSLLLCAAATVSATTCAAEVGWLEAGVAVGLPATDRNDGFDSYEVVGDHRLLWRWASGWELGTRLRITAGLLRDNGDAGFIGAVGPVFRLQRQGSHVFAEAGVRAALLSEHEFDDRDLGGPVQFVSHIGLGLTIGSRLSLAYHFQHVSNADLYDPNPGLELHGIALSYRF